MTEATTKSHCGGPDGDNRVSQEYRVRAERVASHRERDDNYCGVIAVLGNRWRVIECSRGLQWAVQRRVAGRARRTEWVAVSFHLSRTSLIAASVRLCGSADPSALAILAALPAHHGGGA